MDRVAEAFKRFRRNRRLLRAEKGLPSEGMAPAPRREPVSDERAFEGVDANPEELILRAEDLRRDGLARTALLTKWALAGLATEMTMHETNVLVGEIRAFARNLVARDPEDARNRRLQWASEKLADDFRFLSGFRGTADERYLTAVQILDLTRKEYSHLEHRRILRIEMSEAFEHSKYRGGARAHGAVFSNLIRNAVAAAHDPTAETPVVLRFDVREVEEPEYDDDGEPTGGTVEREVIAVCDNGPGIHPDLGEAVFEPGVSGRRSSGIGLHLCRTALRDQGLTITLDAAKGALGGAAFLIGPRRLLESGAAPDPEADGLLAAAAASLAELVSDGHAPEAEDLAEVCGMANERAMLIRLRGARTASERALLAAVEELRTALENFDPAVKDFKPR